jgi:hypothetical protein
MDDPAWPSHPSLHRMMYWSDALGERPHDHVRRDVPDAHRRAVAFILKHGKDAHPETQAMGWASCRICGVNLGSRDMTAFGFVWPEKAEHYVTAHGVWTPECSAILQRALSAPTAP